jgi:hypothetical protein
MFWGGWVGLRLSHASVRMYGIAQLVNIDRSPPLPASYGPTFRGFSCACIVPLTCRCVATSQELHASDPDISYFIGPSTLAD